jgi:hypothetical protein
VWYTKALLAANLHTDKLQVVLVDKYTCQAAWPTHEITVSIEARS